jgi:hypothetical protein
MLGMGVAGVGPGGVSSKDFAQSFGSDAFGRIDGEPVEDGKFLWNKIIDLIKRDVMGNRLMMEVVLYDAYDAKLSINVGDKSWGTGPG